MYWPLTPCQLLVKTNEPIPRKLLNGRTDGRTDRPYFIGPFQPRPGVNLAIELLRLYISIIWIKDIPVYRYNALYKSGKKAQVRRINISGGHPLSLSYPLICRYNNKSVQQ